MNGKLSNAEERFRQGTLFKKIGKFLFRPFKHGFLMLLFLFLFLTYLAIGFGLVSHPSLTLFFSRSPGLETEANTFLKSQGIICADPPKVYVLTEDLKSIFKWPYTFAFKLLIDEFRYTEQINQSFSAIEGNAIVMQGEEARDPWVLAHETGHLAQFCKNPEGFEYQTPIQKEKFADSFQGAIQSEFYKRRPYR